MSKLIGLLKKAVTFIFTFFTVRAVQNIYENEALKENVKNFAKSVRKDKFDTTSNAARILESVKDTLWDCAIFVGYIFVSILYSVSFVIGAIVGFICSMILGGISWQR